MFFILTINKRKERNLDNTCNFSVYWLSDIKLVNVIDNHLSIQCLVRDGNE